MWHSNTAEESTWYVALKYSVIADAGVNIYYDLISVPPALPLSYVRMLPSNSWVIENVMELC